MLGCLFAFPPISMFPALYSYADLGPIALRLALAAIFFVHGPPKLSGKMGPFMAAVGLAETVGAVSVFLGLFTQIGAILLGAIMVGATYKKISEWHIPFTAMDKTGWEFDVLILAACVLLLLVGPGAYSLDALIG